MESFNKFIEVLEKQSKIYEDILEIAKNKTTVIVEGKVQELENITKVEQTLILKIGSLEDEFEKATKKLIQELGIKEKDITISLILGYLQGEQKDLLQKQRDKISDILVDLDNTNKLNAQLIKNSLEYINFSVNLFSNVNSDANGSYQEDGEIKGSKSSFFDVKL